jgi:hypothetical protein
MVSVRNFEGNPVDRFKICSRRRDIDSMTRIYPTAENEREAIAI